MRKEYAFQYFAPTLHSFMFGNVFFEDTTNKVASFDIYHITKENEPRKVMSVTDVNADNNGILLPNVSLETYAKSPLLARALADVANAFKKTEYDLKAGSCFNKYLTSGTLGRLELLANLSAMALQFQYLKDAMLVQMYTNNPQGAKRIFWGHVGNTKLYFDLPYLVETTITYITAGIATDDVDLDAYLEQLMEYARSINQYSVGYRVLNYDDTWGNHMTVKDILTLYL